MSANSSKIYVREELARMQGILKTVELNMEDRAEIERLESEAEKGVLMGLCKGVNVGVREALRKRHLIGALSDGTMQWPRCSLIKMVCGSELVGEEVIDAAKREEGKQKGDLVVGEIVFNKDRINIMRSKHDEMRVQILPLEMPERLGSSAIVGSPSPPADLYIKRRMGLDTNDPKLGTILVGFD